MTGAFPAHEPQARRAAIRTPTLPQGMEARKRYLERNGITMEFPKAYLEFQRQIYEEAKRNDPDDL